MSSGKTEIITIGFQHSFLCVVQFSKPHGTNTHQGHCYKLSVINQYIDSLISAC